MQGIPLVSPGLIGWLYRVSKIKYGATVQMTVQVMKGSIFREMMQLVQEQTEALEKQIFGGFTDEEMAKFEERQRRIRELYSREEFKRAASA
jgi:hypothetical protein